MSSFRIVLFALVLCFSFAPAVAGLDEAEVPEGKRTTLGLYATPAEAFAAWEADSASVTIIDVRTPEEFIFVGHPTMAWNVPFMSQTLDWDEEKARFAMRPNEDFVAAVNGIAEPGDTLYLVCRSGGRSAMAVDALAEAGFTNAWSIVEGVEGDKVKDEAREDFGHRTINGWKNAGLPWTYAIDREKMVLPGSD